MDNSSGALSKQAFLEKFLSINTSSKKIKYSLKASKSVVITVGSLLFKKDKISIPEAHVDKKFKKFFLHHVSNWKLKWRKINLNLKFLIFVIAD